MAGDAWIASASTAQHGRPAGAIRPWRMRPTLTHGNRGRSDGARAGTNKTNTRRRKKKRWRRAGRARTANVLKGGDTLGLLLVTQLKVLAPGQGLVRLVLAEGALETKYDLLRGLGLWECSTTNKREAEGNPK